MQKMLNAIETTIEEEYRKIQQNGKILDGIEKIYWQVKFEHPELARETSL